jgi:DNA-binding CsgD family transcriptional regulator
MPSYIKKLLSAMRDLWNTQEILKFSNIRVGYLHYLFAFPFALIFVNIQDCLLASNMYVFGLPAITVTFISFAVGATVMFILYNPKNIHIVSKTSSIMTLIGFIPWLFLPDGYPSFICAVVFMAGVGGCVANSDLSFMFALNNAERFFGCAFMTVFICLVKANSAFIMQHSFIRISLITILVVGVAVCMYRTKVSDFADIAKKSIKRYDPSIWLSMFILLSYFIIRILGFYVPEYNMVFYSPLGIILALIPALLCVVIQMAFNRSAWTMCNVFFISAIMSYVMGFVHTLEAAYVFAMLKEVGLLVGFYLLTCVQNKYCDFPKHKITALIFMVTIGATFVVPDILIKTTLTYTVAVAASAGLFLAFLLLSPAFSQYLFSADWSRDFASLYMSEIEAHVSLAQSDGETLLLSEKDELLTSEEIDVALLLLDGETQNGISRKLHRSAAEVNQQLNSIRDKVVREGDPAPGIAAAIREFKLTRRETDMLRCLCRSMTNAEIATELFLAVGTVRIHIRNLLKKLPAVKRHDVAEWAETFAKKSE